MLLIKMMCQASYYCAFVEVHWNVLNIIKIIIIDKVA